ncbi:hypothetical protein [uncultured Sphingomonas sp.]|uniref:hypothetical protein n=1 Tax=uncultured Sphingomonas sp. TaxID=158754 RepID=UPI0035CB19C4
MHRIDDSGSVIRIVGEGFFAEDEVRRHFGTLASIFARRRQSARQVKVVIDLRGAVTQSMSVTRIIAEATNRLYSDPSDRVAIIVSSTLLKLQFERVHQHQVVRICLTPAEAEHFVAPALAVTS